MPKPNQITNSGAKTIVGIFCDRISKGYKDSFKKGIRYRSTAVKSPIHVPIIKPVTLKFTVERR
jgi:hypothetical protein